MRLPSNPVFRCIVLLVAALLSFGSSNVSTVLPSAAHMLMVFGEAPHGPVEAGSLTGEMYIPDFNNDRFGDVLALAPRYDLSSLPNVGAASAIYGKAGGLSTKRNQLILLDGYEQPNALFGNSAAIGKITGTNFADVVIGAPGATYGQNNFSGAIALYTGSSQGLKFNKVEGGDRAGLFLGFNIAVGKFGDDRYYDVAASAPGLSVNGKSRAGGVDIYEGPNLDFKQRWTLASPNIKGFPRIDDGLGYVFAADFNGDERDDLAIGTGNGEGARGFVNILYSNANGLTSKGNQLVQLSRRTPGDNFGWRVGACYCNSDRYTDLTIAAPGYDNNKGAAFVLLGSARGVTTNGSSFLQSASAREGDRFSYEINGIGTPGMYVFAFGSPDADFNGVEDSGRVDLLEYSRNRWSSLTLGTPNVLGRHFGFSGAFTANQSLQYFFHAGLPGSTVNGKTDAGQFLSGTLKFNLGGPIVRNRKFFHLDKLAGTNQSDARFAERFAIYPMRYWDDDDW